MLHNIDYVVKPGGILGFCGLLGVKVPLADEKIFAGRGIFVQNDKKRCNLLT